MNKNSAHYFFWKILCNYSSLYKHIAVASLLVNVFSLAMPLFIMNVYDRIVPNAAFESLWVLSISVFIILTLDFILRNTRAYFVDAANKNMGVLLLAKFIDTFLNIRLDANPAPSVGGIMAQIRQVEYAKDFFGSSTLIALLDIPFILLFLVVIAYLGGAIVFIPIIAIPLLALYQYYLQIPFENATKEQLQKNIQQNSLLGEIALGYENIKCSHLAPAFAQKWDVVTEKNADAHKKSKLLGVVTAQSNIFFGSLLTLTMIIVGVYRIGAGSMSMGGLIACVLILGRAMAPLYGVVNVLSHWHKAGLGLDSLTKFMDMPVEYARGQDDEILHEPQSLVQEKTPVPRALPVEIRLEDVSFAYPSQHDDIMALSHINLKVGVGEHIVVLGESGSGKSSLARIISGLYLPTTGKVFYGSAVLGENNLEAIRLNMGVLPQQNVLFKGSIRSNILEAWPHDVDFNEEELQEVAIVSGVMDFASKHPLGLDMHVGENGAGLSGGQRQAVALARALVGKPQILILDEPSSHMDVNAEARLVQRLQNHMQDKTVILLTHSQSMLPLGQRMLVMQDGKIMRDAKLQRMSKEEATQLQKNQALTIKQELS